MIGVMNGETRSSYYGSRNTSTITITLIITITIITIIILIITITITSTIVIITYYRRQELLDGSPAVNYEKFEQWARLPARFRVWVLGLQVLGYVGMGDVWRKTFNPKP